MKIIVESEEEKKKLLGIFKYLHNFCIYRSPFRGITSVHPRTPESNTAVHNGDLVFLELGDDVGNELRHLYLNPDSIEVNQDDRDGAR